METILPVSYALEQGFLHLIASGHYAPEDIPRQFKAGLSDPACAPTVALMLDVRESEVLGGRTPDQIRQVAEFLKPYAERIGRRCAVIVRSDAHYGLARMGSVYADGFGVEVNVFRTTEEGIAWLKARPEAPPESARGN